MSFENVCCRNLWVVILPFSLNTWNNMFKLFICLFFWYLRSFKICDVENCEYGSRLLV